MAIDYDKILAKTLEDTEVWLKAFRTDGSYEKQPIIDCLRNRTFENDRMIALLGEGPAHAAPLCILGAAIIELENDLPRMIVENSWNYSTNKSYIYEIFKDGVDWEYLKNTCVECVEFQLCENMDMPKFDQKTKDHIWNTLYFHELKDQSKNVLRSAYTGLWDYYDMSFCESVYKQLPDQEHPFLNESLFPAFKAGLGFIVTLGNLLVGIVLPESHRDEENRLHYELGPAIYWKDGTKSWWWHNVRVNKRIIEEYKDITAEEVVKERNQELKRIMVERIGYEKIVNELGGKVIQQDDFGKLIEVTKLGDDNGKSARFCHVKDPSTERMYMIRVDPNTKTCKEGLGMTFRMSEEDYQPIKET